MLVYLLTSQYWIHPNLWLYCMWKKRRKIQQVWIVLLCTAFRIQHLFYNQYKSNNPNLTSWMGSNIDSICVHRSKLVSGACSRWVNFPRGLLRHRARGCWESNPAWFAFLPCLLRDILLPWIRLKEKWGQCNWRIFSFFLFFISKWQGLGTDSLCVKYLPCFSAFSFSLHLAIQQHLVQL